LSAGVVELVVRLAVGRDRAFVLDARRAAGGEAPAIYLHRAPHRPGRAAHLYGGSSELLGFRPPARGRPRMPVLAERCRVCDAPITVLMGGAGGLARFYVVERSSVGSCSRCIVEAFRRP
jgi:hypothetical protein